MRMVTLSTESEIPKRVYDTNGFIKKAFSIHGDVYNYSKVDYINAKTKVVITCSIHGDFDQTPDGHLHGQGCPVCGRDKNHDTTRGVLKFSTKEYILAAKEVYGERYDYSKTEYLGALSHVTITCPDHGDFQKVASEHIAPSVAAGCQKCGWDWRSRDE